jgi:hypothetical protein
MIKLEKDELTHEWTLVFGKGHTFLHTTNDWRQFWRRITGKTRYNWYTFHLIHVYIENDIMCPGFEIEIALLGLGLRFRHNRSWEGTEMQRRIDEAKKAMESSETPLTPEQHREIEALKALPDNEIDTSDIPEITDFSGFQRGLFYNGNKDSIELWKHNPRKAFNQHLEFLQCMCDGVSASLERLRKGIEEQGLFSDSREEQ